MPLLDNNWLVCLLSILFSFIGVAVWSFFFFNFSSTETTSRRLLVYAFLCGVVAMLSAYLIEQFIFGTFREGTIIYAFIVTASVEEVIKFVILKKFLHSHKVDQIIDGIKIGLYVGLGFAFAENIFYFFNFISTASSISSVVTIITIRALLSTLAHGLYGIVMGYYLSLAKFHAIYRNNFLIISISTAVLLHGFFNYFLLISLGIWSVILMVLILVVVLIWYDDRRNIEVSISTDFINRKSAPFMSSQHELEVILSKQNASLGVFEKLLAWFPHEK